MLHCNSRRDPHLDVRISRCSFTKVYILLLFVLLLMMGKTKCPSRIQRTSKRLSNKQSTRSTGRVNRELLSLDSLAPTPKKRRKNCSTVSVIPPKTNESTKANSNSSTRTTTIVTLPAESTESAHSTTDNDQKTKDSTVAVNQIIRPANQQRSKPQTESTTTENKVNNSSLTASLSTQLTTHSSVSEPPPTIIDSTLGTSNSSSKKATTDTLLVQSTLSAYSTTDNDPKMNISTVRNAKKSQTESTNTENEMNNSSLTASLSTQLTTHSTASEPPPTVIDYPLGTSNSITKTTTSVKFAVESTASDHSTTNNVEKVNDSESLPKENGINNSTASSSANSSTPFSLSEMSQKTIDSSLDKLNSSTRTTTTATLPVESTASVHSTTNNDLKMNDSESLTTENQSSVHPANVLEAFKLVYANKPIPSLQDMNNAKKVRVTKGELQQLSIENLQAIFEEKKLLWSVNKKGVAGKQWAIKKLLENEKDILSRTNLSSLLKASLSTNYLNDQIKEYRFSKNELQSMSLDQLKHIFTVKNIPLSSEMNINNSNNLAIERIIEKQLDQDKARKRPSNSLMPILKKHQMKKVQWRQKNH